MVRKVGLNGVLPFDSQARWSQAKLGYAGSFLFRGLRFFRGSSFGALQKLHTRASTGKRPTAGPTVTGKETPVQKPPIAKMKQIVG